MKPANIKVLYSSLEQPARLVSAAFTLIELLVVITIITLLLSLLMPALGKVRYQARFLQGSTHQRNTSLGLTSFAGDHQDRFPDSVATIGQLDTWWNWQEPMMLIGYRARSPRQFRSMGNYLKTYIEADSLFCPNAPEPYPYLKEAWLAGDSWDNPQTPPILDPLTGVYCYYWNYLGYLDGKRVFRGPTSLVPRRGFSTVISSDYFGFAHWRSPSQWSSCEKLKNARVTPGTWVSSSFWSQPVDQPGLPAVNLNASFVDGHIEKWSPQPTARIKVAITADGSEPYPDGAGPGDIYLPPQAFDR